MIYCFDLSAINQLCDDADRDAIVAGLLAAHRIRITAVNCLRVLGTKDENRRQVLQSFLRKLAAGNAPLVCCRLIQMPVVRVTCQRVSIPR
jgi:hypothetical protein